jgi:hypothetical protein
LASELTAQEIKGAVKVFLFLSTSSKTHQILVIRNIHILFRAMQLEYFKNKVKWSCYTPCMALGEEVSDQNQAPATLNPWYPSYRRLDRPQSLSGCSESILNGTNNSVILSPVVQ